MRVLLDAHVSGRRVGRALREDGLDVLALDEHVEFEGLADPDVLALAAAETRVLVTFNVCDFAPLLQEWAAAGRDHSGRVLVVGLGQAEVGEILRRLRAPLDEPAGWTNRAVFLARRP